MLKDFFYCMPTKIVFGNNEFDNIEKYIDERKTILITTEGFLRRGLIQRLKKISSNIVGIYSNIKSHPEFVDLEKIYKEIHESDFELILAIGGGSVLDASKFFSVYNDKKDTFFVSDMIKGKIPKKHYNLIPIISIPTTAGTGSELTPWATIWDMKERKKYSLHLPELFSKIAIYDPSLTLSVPKDITLQTGLDTLSHALESIWNKNANEITINYAIKSSRLILKYLPLLLKNLENIEYREKIMKACMYAGLAFSNTQTALAHALSYYITANKSIPHGIACSFTLPLLIDNIVGKYDFIDEALVSIFGEASSSKLNIFFEELNISTKFSDYGLNENEELLLFDSLKDNQRAGNSLVRINKN